MNRTVLVVDDEPSIRALLREYLQAEGYDVVEAGTGEGALQALGTIGEPAPTPIDLVLLDVGLPDVDGLQVLTQLRRTSQVYVMLVTARAEEMDKLVGLTVGADDYITKPFSPREIVARVKAVFRRMATTPEPVDDERIVVGGLVIDEERREVFVDGEPVELSALDFDLLVALASSPGRVYSRVQLLEKVWGYDFYGDERVVDVHIRTMRKALGDDSGEPRFIATVRGVGYKLLPAKAG